MALTIVVKGRGDDPEAPEVALTFDAPRVVVGRSRSCDLCLPDPSVAKRHASFHEKGGRAHVQDEGSLNGVALDRTAIPPRTATVLAGGAMVRVGRYWLEVRQEGGVGSGAAAARRATAELVRRRLVAEGEPATAHLAVVGAAGPTGERLELRDDGREHLVGRGKDCDLVLADEHASRRHLGVLRTVDGWAVRDLGSKRGSFVRKLDATDGAPVEVPLEGEPRALGPRDLVRVGDTLLRLHDPVGEALEEALASPEQRLGSDELREAAPRGPTASERDDETAASPEPAPASGARDSDPGADALEPRGASRTSVERARGASSALATLDAVVFLVALGLLVLSLLGLTWLLR